MAKVRKVPEKSLPFSRYDGKLAAHWLMPQNSIPSKAAGSHMRICTLSARPSCSCPHATSCCCPLVVPSPCCCPLAVIPSLQLSAPPTPRSLFPVPHSLISTLAVGCFHTFTFPHFPIPRSPFPVPCSPLKAYKNTLATISVIPQNRPIPIGTPNTSHPMRNG